MIDLRSSYGTAVQLFAACTAALATHFAIDLAGDVWMKHDTYDDVVHHSRGVALVGITGILILLCVALICRAVRDVRGERGALREALGQLVCESRAWFVVRVVVTSLLMLVAMETLDSLLATGAFIDLADALGGSIFFGLAFAFPISILFALLTWRLALLMVRLLQPLLRIISTLICYVTRIAADISQQRRNVEPPFFAQRSCALARCAGLRAPPSQLTLFLNS